MKTIDAVRYFKGRSRLARNLRRQDGAFGINRQAIYGWGEYPPIARQYEIEVLTGGDLKAEQEQSNHPSEQAKSA